MNFALQDNAKFGFIISNFWQKVKNSRVNFIYSSVVDILTIHLETKGKTHSDTPKYKKYRCKIYGVDNPIYIL